MPEDVEILYRIVVSLLLGFIVGLQREWSGSSSAGIRTFPLITLLGTMTGAGSSLYGGWVAGAGMAAIGAIVVTGYWLHRTTDRSETGLTTSVAVLVMYAVGVYLAEGYILVAAVAGGSVAVLLQFKGVLHQLVHAMGQADIQAAMQLVLITLVILPLLPNEEMGPYEAFNPFEAWLMVALIVGLSLAGYILYKFFSSGTGTVVAGLVGGLISSTATAASYSRKAAANPAGTSLIALVIIVASTVTFARIVAQVGVVAPGILAEVAPPLLAVMGAMLIGSILTFFLVRNNGDQQMPEQKNPAQLKVALTFGLLYAGVKIAVAAADDLVGDAGIYLVAIVAGLTDVNAITLSTAQLITSDKLDVQTGWRAMLVAAMSNMVFKLGIVWVLGNRRLLLYVGTLFGCGLVTGGVVLWLWPEAA